MQKHLRVRWRLTSSFSPNDGHSCLKTFYFLTKSLSQGGFVWRTEGHSLPSVLRPKQLSVLYRTSQPNCHLGFLVRFSHSLSTYIRIHTLHSVIWIYLFRFISQRYGIEPQNSFQVQIYKKYPNIVRTKLLSKNLNYSLSNTTVLLIQDALIFRSIIIYYCSFQKSEKLTFLSNFSVHFLFIKCSHSKPSANDW